MQHRIPVASLGQDGAAMARAVETCVHCGFCLPACPTYQVLGEEMDSPRGRIVLMKQALEGEIAVSDALPHVDRCLGCLACVTACPSGVQYGGLLVPFRARAEREARGPLERMRRRALLAVLESPALFRMAVRAGHLARHARALLPGRMRQMLALLPPSLAPARQLPPLVRATELKLGPPADPTAPIGQMGGPTVLPPAGGPNFSSAAPAAPPAATARPRARVALLTGCVQQVLAPGINAATARVLSANGIEVAIPPAQGCCGALALHAGHAAHARERAARLLRAFPAGVDAIVTNAAGCGSAMKEYGVLFEGTPLEDEAARFAARVRDVSEVLDELGLVEVPVLPAPLTVAYHDACHLSHAQKVRAAPRRLLGRIANLTIREIPDGEICCGSAGLYNLEQPETAAALGRSKARAIVTTGAQAVVAGNVGCMVQIAAHLERAGHSLPVLHTMQVLDRASSAR